MKEKKISPAKKHAKTENLSIYASVRLIGSNGSEIKSDSGHSVFRMAPCGLFVYAKDYLDSAKLLSKSESSFSPSRYFLILRSIELSLKAFLSCSGCSLNQLSGGPSFGHDLLGLLEECERQGLDNIKELNEKHKDEIRSAAKYYLEKVFEYPALLESLKGFRDTPDEFVLIEAAEVLVDFIEKPCLAAVNQNDRSAPDD